MKLNIKLFKALQPKRKRLIFHFQALEDLTDGDLSRLAGNIEMGNMRRIAIENLGIRYTDVKNIAHDCGNDSYLFNFEIFHTWFNKTLQDRRSVRNMQLNSYLMSRLIKSICETTTEY